MPSLDELIYGPNPNAQKKQSAQVLGTPLKDLVGNKKINAKWVNGKLIDDKGNVLQEAMSFKDALMGINDFVPVSGDIQAGVMAANDLKQGNYGSAALNSLGLLPFVPALGGVVKNSKKLTKFEKAHELAQKNAVEMLGLPPNNTAMDRAKALGFDTPAYHGTDKSFDAFDPMLSDSARKTGTPSGAMVVTSEPKTAATYGIDYVGDFTTTYKDGANVMPLMVRKGKNLSMNASQGGYTPNWNDLYNPKYPEIESTNDFALMAKSKGKDSATIKNVKDNARMSSAEGDTTFLFNPAQLRSQFAAFDPARAHEADLLGFADVGLLGGLSLTGLAGKVYADKKNKEKNKEKSKN